MNDVFRALLLIIGYVFLAFGLVPSLGWGPYFLSLLGIVAISMSVEAGIGER